MDEVRFSRRPYFIKYKDMYGKERTIRRVPPAKLHDALPTDIVELTKTRSEDFEAGEEYEVKHVSPRHPNVLQLKNDDGQTTFVPYYQMELKEEIAPRPGRDGPDGNPRKNRYLLWP